LPSLQAAVERQRRADCTKRSRIEGVYHWLVIHNATILALLVFVIGAVIIGDGIGSF
jgi:hypothetical protein